MNELKNKIEALLFASGKGLPVENIAEYCESKPAATKKELQKLHEEFKAREGSLLVEEHNNKWKMTVRGKYTEYIKKIVSETELPGPILKTLAVVAYKSPVLQSDIIHMRGQGAYDHIKQLAKQKFLTKDEEGRSYILRITEKFFNYFDVEGDQEIREIFAVLKEKEEERKLQIQEHQEQQIQQKLQGLEVVDANKQGDHEEIFEKNSLGPITKQKSNEEIAEEKEFLNSMDSKIDEIAKRLDSHTIPKRKKEEEESEKDALEEENTNEETQENYL